MDVHESSPTGRHTAQSVGLAWGSAARSLHARHGRDATYLHVPGHVNEATRRGRMERRPAFVVTGLDVSALLHQKPNHRQVVVDARLYTDVTENFR